MQSAKATKPSIPRSPATQSTGLKAQDSPEGFLPSPPTECTLAGRPVLLITRSPHEAMQAYSSLSMRGGSCMRTHGVAVKGERWRCARDTGANMLVTVDDCRVLWVC